MLDSDLIFKIVLAAIVYFGIGALWYSPLLFAKPWMKAVGKTAKEIQEGSNSKTYAITFFSILVLCYVLAHVLRYIDVDNIGEAIMTGFWLWLGFAATTMLINGIFAGRAKSLAAIDSGYHLVGILIASAIVA